MFEKVKKEACLLLTIMLATVFLTGCSITSKTTITETGSGSSEETLSVSKDIWDSVIANYGTDEMVIAYLRTLFPQTEVSISDETVNGTASKVLHLRSEFKDISKFRQTISNMQSTSYITFNPNYYSMSKIYMPLPLEKEEAPATGIMDELEQLISSNKEIEEKLVKELKDMSVTVTMVFPYTVVDTNGSVQEDGKTVVWEIGQLENVQRTYALFQTTNSLAAPKYSGAANGKAYNTGVTLSIDSENLLNEVDVNGEKVESDHLFLSTEGVYKISAKDINGNSSQIQFRIDTTKPSVSGVVSGKTYKSARTVRFSDKGSGIKKAILNGKSVKTGQQVSKKGNYILEVTDKAGNKKTVTFKIK